jgi:hypothetical protein
MECLKRFPARVAKACVALAPGTRVEMWFQNEVQVEQKEQAQLPLGSQGLTSSRRS